MDELKALSEIGNCCLHNEDGVTFFDEKVVLPVCAKMPKNCLLSSEEFGVDRLGSKLTRNEQVELERIDGIVI